MGTCFWLCTCERVRVSTGPRPEVDSTLGWTNSAFSFSHPPGTQWAQAVDPHSGESKDSLERHAGLLLGRGFTLAQVGSGIALGPPGSSPVFPHRHHSHCQHPLHVHSELRRGFL